MHRAPVVGLVVLDGRGAPLPEPLEVAHDLSRSPDMQGSHQLLVVSEEQLKVRKGLIIFASSKMIIDSHFFVNMNAFNVLGCFCVKPFFPLCAFFFSTFRVGKILCSKLVLVSSVLSETV